MFGSKTMQAIDKLTDDELLYSKVQHKERFASLHEAESVIREELEELEETVDACRMGFNNLHRITRGSAEYSLEHMTRLLCINAQHAAAEAIQLAAMCKKLREFDEEGAGKNE